MLKGGLVASGESIQPDGRRGWETAFCVPEISLAGMCDGSGWCWAIPFTMILMVNRPVLPMIPQAGLDEGMPAMHIESHRAFGKGRLRSHAFLQHSNRPDSM